MSRRRRAAPAPLPFTRRLAAAALAVAVAGCGTTPAAFAPVAAAVTASRLSPDLLDEASGLAASRRDDNLLWAHNDSGNAPLLFALDREGNLRGRLRVVGVGNIDWEDVATFELDGRSWILIADVGDNQGERDEATLLLIAEPDPAKLRPGRDLDVHVTAYLPVHYPGGPRDCEAVAVDPAHRRILLLSKRQVPALAYELPLTLDRVEAGRTPEAALVGPLRRLPQPDVLHLVVPTPSGHLRSQPTSLDLSPDGRTAAVLTYGDIWLYQRRGDEPWGVTFARRPQRLPSHGLTQAEAVAFSRDGRELLVTSEGAHAPLLRYALPARFHSPGG